MGEIDPAFIQAIEHRPNPTIIQAEGIPTMDLSIISSLNHLSNTNIDEKLGALIAEIAKACEEWGFFQVINHGVSLQKLESIKLAARKFFSLSKQEKMKVGRDEDNPMGYYDCEHTKNVRDWKQVFDFTIKDVNPLPNDVRTVKSFANRWPDHPPLFRNVAQEYADDVEKLGFKLMELIALSLGLEANRFDRFFEDQTTSFIRLNHYPPCPAPHLALGVGRHKDAGVLTILAQDNDVEGLEVKRKSDGKWIRVKSVPASFIINVGDTIQVWSNDKYESVEHRVVVNEEKDRLSIPFFLNAAHYVNVKPLEELVDEQNVAKYNEFNWGEFFMTRKNSNFKKLQVDNIQISHFKEA
ncbi:unnamed protein product [Amaranthus hypochondriacus]